MSYRNIFGKLLALCLVALTTAAQAQTDPTLEDRLFAVRALGTTLRVLQVTAHPGDEDGALLMKFARGDGAEVTLLTLTRGERGDNLQAVMSPTEQGLLRTMEQLASDAHYGVEQRFTRLVDFGFARTANEAFDRWAGHNTALADIVRVIRETRPDIIVTPFDPNEPDGDGQHEATGILVREAFRAAANPKQFPEQLTDGVEPWQAKRLFALSGAKAFAVYFHAAGVGTGMHEGWQQMADRALAEQHSQGALVHAPRAAVHHYRLLEVAPGFQRPEGASDFADGLNTSIAGMSGEGVTDALHIGSRLKAMDAAVRAAEENVGDRTACLAQLLEYLRNLRAVEDRLVGAKAPAWLRAELETKRRQAEHAVLTTSDIRLQAMLADDGQGGVQHVLYPGANYAVQVRVESSAGVRVVGMELKPEGGRWSPLREWNAGENHAVFRGRVPMDAPFTRPAFVLDNDEDGAYRVLDERNATRALCAPSLQVVAELEIDGEVVRASAPVVVQAEDQSWTPVAIAPPISVIVEPRIHWERRTKTSYGIVEVHVRSNLPKLQNVLLSVHVPSGWHAEPEHEVLDIEQRGEEHTYRFYLIQDFGGEGSYPVRAVVRWGGSVFDQGYTVVRGGGGRLAYDYRQAAGALVSTRVEVPENLSIAYLGVSGDSIPSALRDVNVRVTDLDRGELMNARLGKYWAIVLGPHAVDARGELLGEARSRLLQYVEEGGALVILQQADAERFARYAPLPYALELGTARVSNEASAVERIDEHDPLLWDPNDIKDEDFRGWSEERGRNFAERWDGHFETLLKMSDSGQPVQQGALVRVRYGRGSVVYSGISFDRQLANGVSGALRLLVNLLSSGAELHR